MKLTPSVLKGDCAKNIHSQLFCTNKSYNRLIFRYDSNSGGEREIQRTMLELLNQLDGFDSRGDVKVVYRF